MDPMTKQTEVLNSQPESHVARRIVGVVFSAVEIILAFRLIFKLLAANPGNGFVKLIYNMTQFFVGIFEGIFSRVTTSGADIKSVFEPATLIAMVIIALVAWAVMKIMTPRASSRVEKTKYTGPVNPDNTKK